MNLKRIIGSAILVLLVAAGLWWFTPTTPAPVKMAAASPAPKTAIPEAHYVMDPKSPALHPPPPTPMAPPPTPAQPPQAPNSATRSLASTSVPAVNPPAPPRWVPATPPPAVANPQGDLKTALPDLARLWRAGDLMAMMQNYMPPDNLAKITPQQMQRIQAVQVDAQAQDAQTQQTREAMAQSLESLQGQTPALNATGDEATHMLLHPPRPLPAPNNGDYTTMPFVMVKINGKWYIKEFQGP